MKIIKILDVEIPIVDGPIGINCSGGADSSLLLYILMKNSLDLIHIFTLADDEKCRSSAIISSKVIEKIIQLTGNSNIQHHVTYAKEQTILNVNKTVTFFENLNLIKVWYSGLTANPDKEIGDSFGDNNSQYLIRNPLVKRNVINGSKITPFTNFNKKTVAKLYMELGIMDSIFPLTRSCESKHRLNYLGHCGKCWWCKEREWGFSEYDKLF